MNSYRQQLCSYATPHGVKNCTERSRPLSHIPTYYCLITKRKEKKSYLDIIQNSVDKNDKIVPVLPIHHITKQEKNGLISTVIPSLIFSMSPHRAFLRHNATLYVNSYIYHGWCMAIFLRMLTTEICLLKTFLQYHFF